MHKKTPLTESRSLIHRSVASLVAAAGLILAAGPAAAAQREVVDRVAAVIEDEIITQRELEAKATPYMSQLENIKDPAQREKRQREIYLQVLNIEIGDKMVARELDKNRDKLGVTDQDVDRAIEQVQRDNHLSRDQLQAALYGQGMTLSEYRKKLREQIERARLVQFRVQGKVQIKDTDVAHRCEERLHQKSTAAQVCAAHILIAVPANAAKEEEEKLRLKATRLQTEIANGADFSSYAFKNSDDKAAPDGKLGCFGRGEMEPAFEEAAFALEVGSVSQVVRTPYGFHIIKVYDRKTNSTGSCQDEQILAGVRNEMYQEEMERQMDLWITELRNKAFVEIRI
jgi:parvulin-like peptidyl-prolyl isomerase